MWGTRQCYLNEQEFCVMGVCSLNRIYRSFLGVMPVTGLARDEEIGKKKL